MLAAAIICAAVGIWKYIQEKDAGETYTELRQEIRTDKNREKRQEEPVQGKEPVEIPVDFTALQKRNPDVYAWITIPGTQIDYPILQSQQDDTYYLTHTIDGEERPLEDWHREVLKGFYSTFKSADEDLQFVLLTGVTKFSQVSVFSGFNQPADISMDEQYETLCGITQEELEHYFAEPIEALAKKYETTLDGYGKDRQNLHEFLEQVEKKVDYKVWFHGHYHTDQLYRTKEDRPVLCLFDQVICLNDFMKEFNES